MKNSKKNVLNSVLALVLCISMFIGSTFAWFTDSVTSKENVITSGNLDIEMYWTDDLEGGEWYNVEGDEHNTIFSYNNWEPGYTDVKYIKLVNAGDLALNYELSLTSQNGVGKLAEVINVYFAEGGIEMDNRSDLSNLGAIGLLKNVMDGGSTARGTLLAAEQESPIHPSGEVIMTIAMNMITTAGNEYQNEDAGHFTITALATQAPYEEDSFGSDYDADAEYPTILIEKQASASVTPIDNKVPAGGVTIIGDGISATVPEGVLLDEGEDTLTLSITPLENTTSDITVVNGEILIPVDVHIDGVSENNTVPIIIELGEVLPKYLNMGNYTLIHVEDGVNTLMKCVVDSSELTVHNRFTYDADTGAITVAMASFSEVAAIANTVNPWNGGFVYEFSGSGSKTDPYIISSADELAGFGAIVGGMNGQKQNSFTGKYVKLISNINLGDGEDAPNPNVLFYPIGYYNSTGSYTRTCDEVTSGINSFEGYFDGAGHTISNFYQNTWEMFGDYNTGYSNGSNYYKDAMGLFSYVVNGKVENLTVDNFSSDGEFTPTGVIATYAVNSNFSNIAITNCTPRVYNTGNGGIVGIGGNDDDPDSYKLTFTNVTIDNTNTITALWGSWDVACGGLVGMFRGDGHVHMTNCHVAAKMDVYNDVCGNYQYYWYRYSGMMVGTNKNMTTDANGYTVPETKKFHAEGCTVHFGDWNDYYYCELVANSLASYTHDHQFSRLEIINSLSEISDDGGKTWKKTGNFLVFGENGKQKVSGEGTCYHIMKDANGNLYEHKHDVKDSTNEEIYETVNGEQILKEENQRIYLPFNQLFTGYGWGVKHIPVYNGEDYAFEGITILDRQVADSNEKFVYADTVPTGYIFRVGNGDAFTIDKLFKAKEGADINETGVYVSVSSMVEGAVISGTFTRADKWEQSTLKINGTGVAKITIQDYDYCTPTVLNVEVVDATNVTTYSELGNKNSVLLNDIEMSSGGSYYLSGATLYGNGFTFDMSEGTYAAGGNTSSNYVFGLNNASIDNVKVVGAVYTKYGATVQSAYNRAAVLSTGNSTITNSYVSNCASAVRVKEGNLEIVNSTIQGGNFANIDIRGGHVVLDNVTTINQVNGNDKADDETVVVGLGVVVYYENVLNTTTIDVKNGITQYNYLSKSQAEKYIKDTTASKLTTEMFDSQYSGIQYSDGSDTWVNAGILSMTEAVGNTNISDVDGYVNASPSMTGVTGYLHTKKPDANSISKTPQEYVTVGQGAIAPSYSFDYTTKNYVAKTDGSNDYCYQQDGTVYISMDDGDSFSWNTSILAVTKNGKELNYTVSMNGNDYTGKNISFSEAGIYAVKFKYTDSYNYGLDSDKNISTYNRAYEKTVVVSVAVIEASAKNAEFTMGSSNAATEKITIDNTTYVSATGVSADNLTWSYMTISGQKIYYPIVAAKLTSTQGSSSYAYFPVFENVVTITDYADSGTGDAFIYNSSTTTLPSTLTAVKGVYKAASDIPYWYNLNNSSLTQSGASKIFKWASGSDAPSNPEKYKNVLCYKSPQISANRDAYITLVQYSYTDATNTTYYYYVGYTLEAFTYKQCVTPDTLITLADGTQKEVQKLTGDEQLLVWNHTTGSMDVSPIAYIVDHGGEEREVEVIHLYFEDGKDIEIIGEHVFYDADMNKYVTLDADAEQYIGHNFISASSDNKTLIKSKLVRVEKEVRKTAVYEVVTYQNITCFTDGILSASAYLDKILNVFDINSETMSYIAEEVMDDIATYGLYTYEDFEGLISEEAFEMYNAKYLKIAVGKGYITWEDILALIDIYFDVDVQPL